MCKRNMKNYRLVGPDNQTVLHMLCAYSNVYSHMVCVEMWMDFQTLT